MSEPTNVQKTIALLRKGLSHSSSSAELQPVLEEALKVLKSEKSVPYGCHCDLESQDEGFEPDGCVLDENRPQDCIYAAGLMDKWECRYWQAILKKEKAG